MLLKMLYNHSYTRVDLLSWYFSYLYRSSIVMSIRPLKFFAWLRCCLQCLVAVRLKYVSVVTLTAACQSNFSKTSLFFWSRLETRVELQMRAPGTQLYFQDDGHYKTALEAVFS